MNRKAWTGLLLATLLPLAGYFSVKYFSRQAVQMPRHYYTPDSIVLAKKRGKLVADTVWHKIKAIPFINQLGQKVTIDSVKNKMLVIDFFFTRCPTICPGLARNMKRLQASYIKNDTIVQFISISVDPEHDSVPNLRKFADRYNANHDTWWFVTGNKKEIYDFALQEIKASIADVNVDSAFVHTELFFLVDKQRVVRGFYNGFDSVALAKLARDIPTLMLEKNRTTPSIFREFIPILPVIFFGIGLVIFITIWLNRRKNKGI